MNSIFEEYIWCLAHDIINENEELKRKYMKEQMNINKITVAGCGTMGHSMAQIFARKGFSVILWNHSSAGLEKAASKIAPELLKSIELTEDYSAFSSRDLIIECISENMELKQDFFRKISPMADDNCIIATNTSGLSINKLSTAVKNPERFLGMHWWNPPALIPLIEIINSEKTSKDVTEAIRSLCLALDKKPAVVKKDVPGFAGNRIQLAVIREIMSMLDQDVIDMEDVDNVMKYGLGIRWACIGQLESLDLGGIDIFYRISEYLMPDLENSPDIPGLLREKYEKGEYGIKTGKGFYSYPDGKAAAVRRRHTAGGRRIKARSRTRWRRC